MLDRLQIGANDPIVKEDTLLSTLFFIRSYLFMTPAITLRPYMPTDWDDVARIYCEGIETGHATFEATPKPQNQFEGESVAGSGVVAITEHDDILGWAILWPASDRCAYQGVAEISVYTSLQARGKGVGTALLNQIIAFSEANGIWTLTAGIFPENPASTALHQKVGFRIIGVRKAIGKMTYGPMQGQWRDNQLLERRSTVIGID